MSRINRKKELIRKKENIIKTIKYYEVLENMIKNDDEGKTPRMLKTDKTNLIKWLSENKHINEKLKKEYQRIDKELSNL